MKILDQLSDKLVKTIIQKIRTDERGYLLVGVELQSPRCGRTFKISYPGVALAKVQ